MAQEFDDSALITAFAHVLEDLFGPRPRPMDDMGYLIRDLSPIVKISFPEWGGTTMEGPAERIARTLFGIVDDNNLTLMSRASEATVTYSGVGVGTVTGELEIAGTVNEATSRMGFGQVGQRDKDLLLVAMTFADCDGQLKLSVLVVTSAPQPSRLRMRLTESTAQ